MKIVVDKPLRSSNVDTNLVEIPRNRVLQEKEAIRMKRIEDLPVPPNKMNAIALVLAYTSFGLCDEDISSILNIDVLQVQRIRMLDEYSIIKKDLVEELRTNDLDAVRNLIQSHGKAAANRLGTLVFHADPNISLAASKDVLDRCGQRPVDVVEHKHTMSGGLTIEFIKRDTKEVPIIDINMKEIN